MGSYQTERDYRLDFFRGLGLLVIYSNHVAEISHRSIFMIFSWRVIGISDAAELFIFISGFLFGSIYYKTFLTQGYGACQRRAAFRSLQIYLANLATLVTVVSLAYLFHRHHQKILEDNDLDPFFTHTLHAIKSFLLLDDMPGVFDVLFLYVFFLLFMPLLLYLFHRRPRLAVLVSLLLYAASFKDPVMKLLGHFKMFAFTLDPLAWQLLFFIGMILGMKRRTGTLKLPARPRWAALAAGIIALIFVLKMATYGIQYHWLGLERYQRIAPHLLPLSGKLKLEPLRLVHFFSLVYLVQLLIPPQSALLKSWPALLVIRCGQHSLKIFCSSLILSYLICLIFTRVQLNTVAQFAIIIGGWGILLAMGYLLAALKAKRKPARAVAPLALEPVAALTNDK